MMSETVKVSRQFIEKQFDQLAELITYSNVRLLSVEEVATMLGIAPITLRNYMSQGKIGLRPVKIGTRTLFKKAEVEEFIASL